MTLYRKISGEFVPCSLAEEAALRADPAKLFGNDSGFEVVLADAEAAAIRAQWAANEAAPAPRRLVNKSVIVERLQAADKLAAARAALDLADIYMRERWNTRAAIYADDEAALALLAAIGADAAVILAAE
jgi:hypothetical protein